MILTAAALLLFLLYSGLLLYYRKWWSRVKDAPASSSPPQLKLSVIIPARNEGENIGRILNALQEQLYPKELYEVLVVDDHSTDGTTSIVMQETGNVKLVSLAPDKVGKKKAIEAGVANATGEWIITTDADCIPGPHWLHMITSFAAANDSVFIAAPVQYEHNGSLLETFQTLDFMTLQGITAASVASGFHSMCNGANLAYKKEAFEEVAGFEGIDKLASGDDLLLMHKIWTKHPQQVHYLKAPEAIVLTKPMPTWKQFFSQRIRWASKTTYYEDKRIFWSLVLVYFFNVVFIVLALAGFWNHYYWQAALALLLLKTLVELTFLIPVARFFKQQKLLWLFPLCQPLHILYTVTIGLISQFGSYQWKGRTTK